MFKKVLPILFILFLIGCSIPDEFGIPTWTIPIRLVLLNDIYDAEAIAEEMTSLRASGDTLQFYELITESQILGDIEINDTDVKTSEFLLTDIAPELSQFNGLPVNVLPNYPDITIPIDITRDFEPFDEYEEIKFLSGSLLLTITNNTVFWLGDSLDGNPLIIDVLDGDGVPLVEEVEFADIAPMGGSDTQPIPLDDEIFPNDIQIQLTGEGDITSDSTAVIDTTASVQLDIQIVDIQADYVINGQIPSQEIDPISGYREVDIIQPEIVHQDSFELSGYGAIIFEVTSVVPAIASFELVAIRDTTEIYLEHDEGQPIEIQVGIGTSQIVFSNEHYNINEMIQILPDGFDYSLTPYIGVGTVIPYLCYEDSVVIDFEVVADMQILTYEDVGIWIIPLDEGEINIEVEDVSDFKQEMQDSYQSGKMIFKYWNVSGMEVAFDILFSDDSTQVLDQVFNFEDSVLVGVEMFRVPLLEITSDTIYKEVELNITQDELDYFVGDSIYVVPRIQVISAGTQPWAGGIRVQGDIVLEIEINSDLIDSFGN
ncbi:MAG: hypothetical protein ISS80_00745 [Candidatus Cloacimonetes bacterium]|nr:hypothetical protein [Candidatus Cloacimonadota bacterium]